MDLNHDAVLWSSSLAESPGRPLLVMMHGYGANEHDLYGLLPHLSTGAVVASLRAPIDAMDGYAWVPIAIPGRPDPDVVERSTALVLDWLDTHVPERTTVGLLGFSQGGLMVTQLLRHRPDRFACGLVLSGFTIERSGQGDDTLQALRPPVFFGRGDRDPIITDEAFARTEAWLPDHSSLTAKVYPGLGHSIAREELADINAFLSAHLG